MIENGMDCTCKCYIYIQISATDWNNTELCILMLSEVNISVKRDNPVCIFQCKLRVNPAFNFPNFFFFFE